MIVIFQIKAINKDREMINLDITIKMPYLCTNSLNYKKLEIISELLDEKINVIHVQAIIPL